MSNENKTWVIGGFRIYVARLEDGDWEFSVRHTDMGWQINRFTDDFTESLIAALDLAQSIQSCNYRQNYQIEYEGQTLTINAMPQNTVEHVIIDALEQLGKWDVQHREKVHDWRLMNPLGEAAFNHHIHIYTNPNLQPLRLVSKD